MYCTQCVCVILFITITIIISLSLFSFFVLEQTLGPLDTARAGFAAFSATTGLAAFSDMFCATGVLRCGGACSGGERGVPEYGRVLRRASDAIATPSDRLRRASMESWTRRLKRLVRPPAGGRNRVWRAGRPADAQRRGPRAAGCRKCGRSEGSAGARGASRAPPPSRRCR